jgi:hypothetical protein
MMAMPSVQVISDVLAAHLRNNAARRQEVAAAKA